MKTKLLLIFSIFYFSIAASTHAQKTALGVKGGFNLSNVSGSDLNPSFRFNTYLGGKINIYAEEKMSIQPEIYVSWQGARYKSDDETIKLNYTFLNIPVLYKYWYKTNINFYAGPQMGIKISAKLKDSEETLSINNQIKTIDFALVFGGEYFFTDQIAAELRFNLGFSNLLENPFIDQKQRQRVLQLGASYYF